MSVATTSSREAAQEQHPASAAGAASESAARENRAKLRRTSERAAQPNRHATDDEILGIGNASAPARSQSSQLDADFDASNDGAQTDQDAAALDTSATSADRQDHAVADEQLQAALDASPELRRAWQDAQSYREAFATPDEARAATALLGDLNRMDALFFSQRPEDHAELARAVANLDPAAFASLAQAMSHLAMNGMPAPQQSAQATQQTTASPTETARSSTPVNSRSESTTNPSSSARTEPLRSSTASRQSAGPSPAQVEFLHTANAAAVQGVLDAVETQVDRLLPEGVSKTARNRVVGEIYRELDASLASNRQLGQQMRDAFRSGSLDAAHQRAVVALVTGRARQALPGIAKRVLNEWTSTVVAANQDRLSRQRAAAHRVDIAGSGRGGDGARRSIGPRDIDYGRMSDSDILNL
ncbi:MAG: hypothetical protein ACRD4R_00230 [Candidatus Acidiferrales bacterium]